MTAGTSTAPTTRCGDHTVHWLDDGRQRLGLVPGFGGSVAAWLLHPQAGAAPRQPEVPFHLWRPWFGDPDPFSVASLPLVPWSNRISGGGFEQDGVFHPLAPNRAGEACPIHGEGWLQAWGELKAHRIVGIRADADGHWLEVVVGPGGYADVVRRVRQGIRAGARDRDDSKRAVDVPSGEQWSSPGIREIRVLYPAACQRCGERRRIGRQSAERLHLFLQR